MSIIVAILAFLVMFNAPEAACILFVLAIYLNDWTFAYREDR